MDVLCQNTIVQGKTQIKEKLYHGILERLLHQNNSFALIVTDEGVIVESIGPNVEMTGFTGAEVVGKAISEFIFNAGQVEWKNRFKRSEAEDEPFVMTLQRKDGSIFLSEVQIFAFEEEQPELFGIIIKDRSGKKGVQDDPIITLERLKQLAAEVAHEIRNPLTSLQGFIQLLRANPERIQEYLQIIDDEIQQIELITAELMLLARPQEFQFKKTHLLEIIEHCLNVMEASAHQRGVEFVRDYEREDIWIVCDGPKIKQVIINLFKNALEAMEKPGQITVKVEKVKEYVSIIIEDQGIGIPDDILAMITEPYFTTKPQGSGLGLIVCKKIVEEHGGFMKITSKEGKGTTFKIALQNRLTESVAKNRELF